MTAAAGPHGSSPAGLRRAVDPPGHGRYRRPPDPWVVGVEPDAVQLCWSGLGSGTTTLRGRWERSADAPAGRVESEATTSSADSATMTLSGLPPGTRVELSVVHDGTTTATVEVHTIAPPPGAELFRFATLSDLHLGSRHLGYLSTVVEDPTPAAPDTVRTARSAIAEATAWGASLLVLKGDLTNRAQPEEWEQLADLLASCALPVLACPGNHDVSNNPGRIDAHQALAEMGIASPSTVQVHDEPGIRLIVADTTTALRDRGRLANATNHVVDAAAGASGQAFVALHHQLHITPVPTYWPPGVSSIDASAFIRRLGAVSHGALVSSGHTHRNRCRQADGVTISEVGSPRDYPGVWAGYVVHEGGIRQVVKRIEDPSLQARIDRTARAAGGLWRRWAPGALSDRSFVVVR